jgi:hypothetical protein
MNTAIAIDPFAPKYCDKCHGLVSGVTSGTAIQRCTCNEQPSDPVQPKPWDSLRDVKLDAFYRRKGEIIAKRIDGFVDYQ